MAEYKHFDGEDFITFDLLSVNADKREAEVAIANRGRITVTTFDLMTDETGALYFEYGCMYDRIYLRTVQKQSSIRTVLFLYRQATNELLFLQRLSDRLPLFGT